MAIVLVLTATITVVELVGGILTGSLALLADAVHMLSDNVALSLALVAVWLAGRPSTPERSFGYQRAEILAALVNGEEYGVQHTTLQVDHARPGSRVVTIGRSNS